MTPEKIIENKLAWLREELFIIGDYGEEAQKVSYAMEVLKDVLNQIKTSSKVGHSPNNQ